MESNSTDKNSKQNTPGGAEGFGKIYESASKIVFKAAHILEEEIAKGIVAAKQIEDKFADTSKFRRPPGSGNAKQSEELLSRFRKDAHDIIDLFIDFAAIAATNVAKISSQIISVKQETQGSTPGQSSPVQTSQVPFIQIPKDMAPGESISMPLKLENDSPDQTLSIEFLNTPLSGVNGLHLPENALTFLPNPLVIPQRSSGTVEVTLKIPETAQAGSYTCFIQGKNIAHLRATLLVRVL
jgi:hypothetical protein